MKSILAIETCSESCSVALHNKGNQHQLLSTQPRGHADNVLVMVDKLLEKAQITLNNLDAIAFTRGPGAFTGVRIGTSVAQGLALASNLPVIAVSSLAVLAQGSYRLTNIQRCLVALDARMSEVYFGVYRLNDQGFMVAEQEEQVSSPANLNVICEAEQVFNQNSWQAMGAGWINYPDIMADRFIRWNYQQHTELLYPEAVDLLTLANWYYENDELIDPADALPVYIRDKVVRSAK